jgi:aminoglycoside 6'-N-acetyltransferase
VTDLDVAFVPTRRADFALLASWLTDPEIHRWWHHDTTPEALERDFGSTIDRSEPAEDFIAILSGSPVGLCQRCRWADYPEEYGSLSAIAKIPSEAMTIDYLIGPAAMRGKGVGPLIINAFVQKLWHDVPATTSILVPVAAGNRASWRALEKCGFARIASGDLTPDNPIDPPLHHLMRLDRPSRGQPR